MGVPLLLYTQHLYRSKRCVFSIKIITRFLNDPLVTRHELPSGCLYCTDPASSWHPSKEPLSTTRSMGCPVAKHLQYDQTPAVPVLLSKQKALSIPVEYVAA